MSRWAALSYSETQTLIPPRRWCPSTVSTRAPSARQRYLSRLLSLQPAPPLPPLPSRLQTPHIHPVLTTLRAAPAGRPRYLRPARGPRVSRVRATPRVCLLQLQFSTPFWLRLSPRSPVGRPGSYGRLYHMVLRNTRIQWYPSTASTRAPPGCPRHLCAGGRGLEVD